VVNILPVNPQPECALSFNSRSQSHIATDGQSVSKTLCRAPSGAHDQIFITVWQLRSCICGATSLIRGRVCLCIFCWPSPAQSLSNPSPLGLATIFYCLSSETSHFVAFYNSRGHGGGIRPRLHRGSLKSQIKIKIMLRRTVSRPVCLGTKPPFGAYDQILIIVWQLRVGWFGAPSLTRERVCRLQLLLVLASTIIFGSDSRRTRGHISLSRLKFESYGPVHVGRPLSREVGSVVCQS
jgi:hypothetical protein